MKILFFLVALANVVLFMWEYKSGAFVPVNKTEQVADSNQQQIRLVSEAPDQSGAIAAMNLSTVPDTDAKNKRNALFPSILDGPVTMHGFTTENGLFPEAMSALVLTERTAKNTLPERSSGTPAVLQQPEARKAQAAQAHQADEAVLEKAGAGLKPAPAKPEVVEKTGISKSANPVICYEAGPFADKSAYQLWLRRLNVDKGAIKPVSRQGEVISAYQVYYPASETLAQSEANVQMLKARGITDLLLLRKGEEQGQISLGVFTTERRALLMQSQMLVQGIRVAIKPRYKPKLQYYALIADQGEVMARLDVLKKNYPDMTVKKLGQCSGD